MTDKPLSNPIDEAMSMEARHMITELKLPAEGELSAAQRTVILQRFKKHRNEHNITFAKVGEQIGVSSSVLSEVSAGKYKGDVDAVLRRIHAWQEDDARRRSRAKPIGFFETNVFRSIRDAASVAKANAVTTRPSMLMDDKPRIVLAVGPPGCGKTVGARALCAEDPNAIYLRIRTNAGTAVALMNLLIASAGWKGRNVNISMLAFAIDKLRYSGRLLIIDEAHKLRESGCEVIRDLADECGIPVLLLGTQRMKDRVTNSRHGVGAYMDDQFARRVAYVVDLLRGSDGKGGDKRPFFTLEEVRAIFRSDQVRLTKDGEDLLCALANTIDIGMLGMALNIFDKAVAAATRRPDRKIDEKLIWQAVERVLLPQGLKLEGDGEHMRKAILASLNRVHQLKRAVV